MHNETTIAAVATPPGTSAIAVLRVSGPLSRETAKGAFGGKGLVPRKAVHGVYRCVSGKIADDCMCIFFEGPRSYTGEDMLEIYCHGNPFIVRRVMEDLMRRGCVAAGPGEFTKRAFLNGKLDLTQAEAVMSVISAGSERAFEASVRLLSGELGRRIQGWESGVLNLLAEIELQIDFTEEDVPVADVEGIRKEILRLADELEGCAGGVRYLSAVYDGINVVIVGAPNAGKSSLFNELVGVERAIVDEEAGTTRDFISERLVFGDFCINLFDTAGIRMEGVSKVERDGIERTFECLRKADFVLYVVDGSGALPCSLDGYLEGIEPGKTLLVYNKEDLPGFKVSEFLNRRFENRISVSLRRKDSVVGMRDVLLRLLKEKEVVPKDDVLIVSLRDAELMREAREVLVCVYEDIGSVPWEFVSLNLRHVMVILSEILGKFDNEKVLERVFSKFCIGK